MTRTVFVAGAAVALLLASMAASELRAQTRTTGGTTGTSGSAFSIGTASTGFGGQTSGAFGAGLQQGYGGLSQQGMGGATQQRQQNRSLTQTLNQNQNRAAQTTQNNTNLQNQVPIRIQVAVIGPRPATVAAAAPVQGKLARVMASRGVGSATTAMWEGDVLVLSGNVANESVRRTIEGIALLQPGVRAVRNETVVGPVPEVTAPQGSQANN